MSTLVISNFLENESVDHILRNLVYASPASVFIALYTSDPTDADVGVEVTGGAYARQELTAGFDVPAVGHTQNTAAIVFPTATGNWGDVTHVGIRDALTGGNLLYHGALSAPQTVNLGDDFEIAAGDLDVSLTVAWSYYLANAWLAHTLNNVAYTTPGTAIWDALFTTAPGRDGAGGVEVSGGSYARINITAWDAPVDGLTGNTNLEQFPVSTADWGDILATAILDASTAGNILFLGNLDVIISMFGGDTFQWEAGGLQVRVS